MVISEEKAEAILLEAVQPHLATDEGQKFLKGMATIERIKVLQNPVDEHPFDFYPHLRIYHIVSDALLITSLVSLITAHWRGS